MSKGSKEIKESTKKLGKIIINPLSDSYNKIKETNAQMSRIRKEHKLDLESYDSAYNDLQKTLENQIALKIKVFESLGAFCDVFEKIKSRPEFNDIQTIGFEIPKVEFAELRDISHWGENFVAFVEKTQKWAEKQTGKIKKFAKTHPLIISILIIYFAPHILVGSIALGPAIPMMASGTGMTLFAVAPILVPRSLARFVLERLIIKAPSVIYKIQADRAELEMNESKTKVQETVELLQKRDALLSKINDVTEQLLSFFNTELSKLETIVNDEAKTEWNQFTDYEVTLTENTVTTVALLYELCKADVINNEEENVSKIQELVCTSYKLLEKEI